MPTRKSGSSDDHSSSPRSVSLRRFSSLASFSTLNPFSSNRKRSNHAPADNNNASETFSGSKLAPTTDCGHAQSYRPSSLIRSDPLPAMEDQSTELNVHKGPTASVTKRSSYICLPEHATSGIPRSRTFSNLPLPSRAKKGASGWHPHKHSRLSSSHLPPTRLPSPEGSTRKHSTGFPSKPQMLARRPAIRAKLQRSDTEPLLPVYKCTNENAGRITAFKENISPGPARPLPHLRSPRDSDRRRDSPFISQAYKLPRSSCPRTVQLYSSDCSNYPSSPPVLSPKVRQSYKPGSSPLKKVSGEDGEERNSIQMPSRQALRWKSQPLLGNTTNLKARHEEVKQRRLLSQRQPPTPDLARNPSFTHAVTTGKLKSSHDLWTHLRPSQPASPEHGPEETSDVEISPLSPKVTGLQVSAKEPPAYWCGRLSALVDRYRTEELLTSLENVKVEPERVAGQWADFRRMRRALEQLHSVCITAPALQSLISFQIQIAMVKEMPDLAEPIPHAHRGKQQKTEKKESAEVGPPQSKGPKVEKSGDGRMSAFMDRLLGRSARNRKSIG